MSRQAVITPEGLEKLKEEIEFLSTTKRREIAARIKEAREDGDISENAEYDDAKNEQAMLEGRIATLEERLRRTIEEWVGEHYGESNRRLAELTGFDLAALGWRLSSAQTSENPSNEEGS